MKGHQRLPLQAQSVANFDMAVMVALNAAKWDRDALECAMGRPGVPRKFA
jgi:hypothetical protein